ncbi:MAG: PAS domain-containing protein [Methanoregulaceae archaeon]
MKIDIKSGCLGDTIVDNAHIMLLVIDRGGTVAVWNRAAETVTGYTKDEVLGKKAIWQKLYPDRAYRHEINGRIHAVLANRNYFENLETTIVTKSGQSRVILWNTREITEATDTRIITVGFDITRQRETEQEVRQLSIFQESIIANAHVLLAVMDKTGNVLVWNKAAEAITGYEKGEVLGGNIIWKKIYPDKEYRKEITAKITSIISSKRYFENLETTILSKTGEERIVAWNTREITEGDEVREIAIGRDITEQRRAEETLTAYISEMAMRLKNPVEIIQANLEDVAGLIKAGSLTIEEVRVILEGQARNAAQISANVRELQKAIAEREDAIPAAYRHFLCG